MIKKLYALPEETPIPELRPMNKSDVFHVAKILNQGLRYKRGFSKFKVKFHFIEEEVKHYFLPRDKIVCICVVRHKEVINGKNKDVVTDFLSFYALPSHIMKNPKHKVL